MPGGTNKSSVLVSCCGKTESSNNDKSPSADSALADPAAHLQGTGPDIDPKELPNKEG